LLFFKRHGVGEYQLYHPIADGPSALLRGQYTPGTPNEQLLDALTEISPELAHASLSFDTGDPPDLIGGRASLGTDILLARIYDSPKRIVRTDYADAWSRYGKRVSAEYSFNFVENRNLFAVFTGPESTPFVHYSLELDPQNFSMETDEDQTKFYTTLDITVEAKDKEGRTVLANDKEVYIELTKSQVESVKASPFAYQDDFPLVAGDYTVSVILRNRVLKQYTVAERELQVEALQGDAPALSDMVLGFASEGLTNAAPGEMRAFQVGGYRIHPAAQSLFAIGDTVHAFAQVAGAGPEYRLRFALLNGTEVLQERTTRVSDYAGGPALEQLPLQNMVGGEYQLTVELADPEGKVVAERTAPVVVSPRSVLARPWVYRRSFNATEAGLLSFARGEQLLMQKKLLEAKAELERAVAANNPRLVAAKWRLAGLLVETGEPDRALDILTPLEAEHPKQWEVVAFLGFAHYLKHDFGKSASYLERAAAIRPADTLLLNALGDSYQKQGDHEKARATFQRSLELDAAQPRVREQLEALGKSP
jgi:tetratricopeptide (TPR) repeat protein